MECGMVRILESNTMKRIIITDLQPGPEGAVNHAFALNPIRLGIGARTKRGYSHKAYLVPSQVKRIKAMVKPNARLDQNERYYHEKTPIISTLYFNYIES